MTHSQHTREEEQQRVAARFAVLHQLYEDNQVGWLAFSKIAMNYPLWAVALLVAVWAVRRADQRFSYCRHA